MTSVSHSLQRRQRLTYARARLLLGMSAVGSAVIAAASVVAFLAPSRWISDATTQSLPAALGTMGMVFAAVHVAMILPDMLGGALLVRHRAGVGDWFARWFRGASTQWLVWMCSAATLMITARLAGASAWFVTIVAFAMLQLLLAQGRGMMARVVAALPVVPTPDRIRTATTLAGVGAHAVTVVRTVDEGFVGGYATMRGGQLLLPERWASLPQEALHASVVRRELLRRSGAHTRGAIGALLWNTLGFTAVLGLTHATAASVYGLVVIIAGMTLWAFVSVLVLPTLSRAAVFAADQAATHTVGAQVMRTSIELLDRWQDDEPSRSPVVETIFHPVPSRVARIARLATRTPAASLRWWHTHHIARHALWMQWAAMTPMSRLVHCNIGRPALWVMLPSD